MKTTKQLLTANEAIEELWRRGVLWWKLRDCQKKIYDAINSTNSLKYVVNSARRLGKSYLLYLRALETALRKPESQIRVIAPTQKMLKNITLPLFREIVKDAPENLRPIWTHNDSKWVCPSNGSEIYIAGANNGHADDSRGTKADEALIDEAAFVDDLKYLVDDILIPQLLTTGGRLIMFSTPPRTPAHAFTGYVQRAMEAGAYSKFTIHQSGYEKSIIEKFKEEAGGENSTTFKREYLCEFVVDEDFAIIPEWNEKYISEYERNEYWRFYKSYVGMDLGVVDKTVALFAIHDFKRGRLHILDELEIHGPKMTTNKLVEMIKEKEKSNFGEKEIYKRVSDTDNPLLLQDLGTLHNLGFLPVVKDSLEAMVNELRINIQNGKIIVSEKCKQTIGCLKFGVWDSARRKFERSENYGHYDALAALIYLNRSIDWNVNPISARYGMNENDYFINNEEVLEQNEKLRQILGIERWI